MQLNRLMIYNMEPNIPCYCFNSDVFSEKIRTFRSLLDPKIDLIFSLKANPFFAQSALDYANGLEACSAGEIEIISRLNKPMSNVTFGGICKERDDFLDALKKGIHRYSIESYTQLLDLDAAAIFCNEKAMALLRITSGNQFGMDVEEAKKCLSFNFQNTKIIGIHYYPGTMRLSTNEIERDYNKFENLLKELADVSIAEIEFGAGIGINYFSEEDINPMINLVADKLNVLAKTHKVTYEAGRFLSADAGVYISRVIEKKFINGRKYIIVNGGRHHFTYHSGMLNLSRLPKISVVQAVQNHESEEATIVGALCSESDILAKDACLPITEIGDYIVLHKAGAYCATEGAALFLSRDIPAVFNIKGTAVSLLRRKTKITSYVEQGEQHERCF